MGTPLDRETLRTLLDRATGLVRSYDVVRLPPPASLHAMVADIGTRFTGTADPTTHDRVGAVDLTPAGALVRGTGEAVERYALAPQEEEPLTHVDGTRRRLVRDGRPCVDRGGWPGLAHPDEDAVTRWYRGSDLGTGAPTWLPAAVVDWPAPAVDGWEGTPSGAAAHRGHDRAMRAALGEVLERDALMAAWLRTDRAGAVRVDLGALRAADPRIQRLAGDRPGLTVGAARLPAAVDSAYAYLAWVDDGRVLAVGAGFDDDEAAGVLASLREAWQIYGLLSSWAPGHGGDGFVADADARCAYWSDGRGRAEFTEWRRALPPAAPLPPGHGGGDVAAELTAQGRSVVVVDLSPRLPAAVQDLGLRAVKVVVQGLQPLLIRDDQPWGVVPDRVRPGPRPGAGPHPLI